MDSQNVQCTIVLVVAYSLHGHFNNCKIKHIIVIRLVVGKDLNPFVVVVTNIDSTIRTKSYTNP